MATAGVPLPPLSPASDSSASRSIGSHPISSEVSSGALESLSGSDLARRLSSTVQAVLFDIDGTLIDSVPMVVAGLGDMYERRLGWRPEPERLRALIGMPLSDQTGLFSDAPITEEESRAMAAHAIERFEVHRHLEGRFEAAIDTLESLASAGVPIGLVTSKSKIELDEFLERFPERHLVGAAVSASDVQIGKPDPEGVRLCATRLGVPPEQCLFIGDSRFDILAGRAAGMTTIGVAYGAGTRESLSASQPHLLLTQPEELRDWIHLFLQHRGESATDVARTDHGP